MPDPLPGRPQGAPGPLRLVAVPLAALGLALLAVGLFFQFTGWTRLVLGFTALIPLWLAAAWAGLGPRRAHRTLHTWVGLASALALFLAFCAGTLTVYGKDLDRWAAPGAPASADLDGFARDLHARHPELKGNFSIALPGAEGEGAVAYWADPTTGAWVFVGEEAFRRGEAAAERKGLGHFFNELHHELALGRAGALLLGGLCLLYALALLTGLVLHLPRGRRVFSIAWRGGARRAWTDAHGALSLAALPLHLVFAVTGALFSLFLVLVATYDATVYRGQLAPRLDAILGTALPQAPAGRPGSPLPLASLLAPVAEASPGFRAEYLRFAHYGDAAGALQVMGRGPGGIAPFGMAAVALDTGEGVEFQLPGRRDGNHALLSSLYGLHFGDFGGEPVRALWALFGLSGAFAFLSGLVAWVEARRVREPRKARAMARATAGFCAGVLLGLAACFPAARLGLPSLGAVFATCLAGAVAAAFLQPLKRSLAAIALLAGAACLSIPVLGPQGHPAVAWTGGAAGLLLLGTAFLARRLRGAWA
ncbi:MAG TPA: PepSY-associated TM helix domain-containing protein [Holophaga sp.]|nr:PepSY-associated TM helix domain-containing protein [Holophaga sp.]